MRAKTLQGSLFSVVVLLSLSIEHLSGEPHKRLSASGAVNSGLLADGSSPRLPGLGKRPRSKALKDYNDLPMAFEQNVGQADPEVQFVARGRGYTLFLTDSEAVVSVQKGESEKRPDETERLLQKMDPKRRKKFEARRFFHAAPRFRGARQTETIRIGLAAANRRPAIEAIAELPGKSNYFVGSDPHTWQTEIPNYRRVRYHGVYPGVDLLFYGSHRQLEFDFIVAPGADPTAIKLDVHGEGHALVVKDGGLSVGSSFGLHRPEIYQLVSGERRVIEGQFVQTGDHEVGIQVGLYDRRQPLIIDPVLSYSTYLGGTGADYSDGIAVDPYGNAYIVGTTTSADFPLSSGYPSVGNSNGIAFIAEIDPTGTNLLYSTYLGGTGGGGGNGIALDPSGHVYVTGYTFSSDFPVVNGLQTTLLNPNGSAFVARIDTTRSGLASLDYSTYLQGGGNSTNSLGDVGLAIAADVNGNAYVTGQTASDASQTSFPTTSTAYQSSLASPNGNAFLTVLNTNQAGTGSLIYSTYLGGASAGFGDYGMGVTVDSNGNAYITGQTTSGGSVPFPTTPSAYQSSLNSSNGNAFLTKIATFQSGSQSLAYSTYLGGTSSVVVGDVGNSIALDSSAKVYVAGDTTSADFPTTSGAFQATNSANGRAFVSKMDFSLSGSASLIYSTYVGGTDGSQGEVANGIAVDANGNAFVVGSTSSDDFPTTSGAVQSTIKNSSWDAFLAELNAAGSGLVYSTYWGGSCSNGDLGFGVAVDSLGNPYLDGSTCSTDYSTYPNNAYQVSLSGSYNAFVAKFAPVTITGLLPPDGNVGTVVEIEGTNFGATQGASTVAFNGTPANVTSWGSTTITVTVPASATTGNVVVTVSGVQSNGVLFRIVPPVISALSPASGAPGTLVTISGSGFGAIQGQAVSFNGLAAPISSWSDISVSAYVPAGATSGNVTVTTATGLASNGVSFAVPLIITGLSSNSGPVGAAVTVTGTGFGAAQGSSVLAFNGSAATVMNWNASSISATVPAGATTGNVLVTVSSANSNAINFNVLPTPVINNLSPNLGQVTTSVTISGTGFGATRSHSTVTFNGVAATTTSWSDTSIVATVPIGATNGSVIVTLDGVASNGVNFTVAAPTLVSIAIAPTNTSILTGATRQFTATGIYIDGTTQDLTSSATWNSTDSTIATIGSSGLATGVAVGQVSIQANVGSASASTSFTVGVFAFGGTLNSARAGHTATVLNNGKVLIGGGSVGSAELYDPTTQFFTITGRPNINRGGNTITLLNDGTVLLVGGFDANGNLASAEIYNPATGTFAFAGSLSGPRTSHSATLLNDGTILIAGGFDASFNVLASTEIYNPATGTFTGSGSMSGARVSPTATLLNDGTVLIAGGYDSTGTALGTAEIFSPRSRTFTPAPSLNNLRGGHTATLLNGGTVLIAGGVDNNFNALTSAEIFDPVTATFTLTGSMNASRESHTATLLNNGQVLIAGGGDDNGTIFSSAELYDPASGTFTTAGNMTISRFSHTASLLNNGNVLLTGGRSTNGDFFFAVAQAELYKPSTLIPPGLASIAINPLTPTNSIGTAQRFAATGTFSDSSTQVLASATWGSSDGTLATVTSDWTNSGSAFAVGTGSPTISACTGSICGATVMTVTAAQLTLTGLSPVAGSVGTPITIAGTGFGATQGGSTVAFNGTPATVSTWNPTGIVATVPSGAVTGNVIATVSGVNSNGALFTVTSAPVIAALSPPLGGTGTSVIITGSNFGGTQGGSSVTFNGVVATPSAWSDSGITASVPNSATTGNVVVYVSGVASNGVGFSIPGISYIAPQSGPAGMLVTIAGSGFGATQGNGVVSIGSTAMSVQSWSDTQIVAAIATGTTSGTVAVQQGSLTLTGPTFTISSSSPYNTSPASLNMIVGDTRTISVMNGNGAAVTGLHWITTNPAIVSLSTDDPPFLTAVTPGSATVYAGVMPISVTVYAATLPSGTTIWSLPLSSSELTIVPAVPSTSGVDVFAVGNRTLSAVTSDGKVAWQTSIDGQVIPDFFGNAYTYALAGCGTNCNTHQVIKLDPVTHNQSVLYRFSTVVDPGFSHWSETDNLLPSQPYHWDRMGTESVIPDTAGNLFIQDINQVVVFNSTGQRVASVPLDMTSITNTAQNQVESLPPAAGKMTVAGDGNAYIPYIYETVVASYANIGLWGATSEDSYLMLLRVSPDGTFARIQLDHQTAVFGPFQTTGCVYGLPNMLIFNFGGMSENLFNISYNSSAPTPLPLSVITNADAGVTMISPEPGPADLSSPGCGTGNANLTYVSSDAVTGQVNLTLSPGALPTFWPQLQLEDGSYIGTVGDASQYAGVVPLNENSPYIARIGPSGVIWKQVVQTGAVRVIPSYVTSDGTIAATSSHDGTLGTLYTLDQTGNVTSQIADTGAAYSWMNNWYADPAGTLSRFTALPLHLMSTYAAVADGNQSDNGTAIQQQWYPPLPSCHDTNLKPPPSCPGPKEAIDDALNSLRTLLAGQCNGCDTNVFTKTVQSFPGNTGSKIQFLKGNQADYLHFVSKDPFFFDGTHSNVRVDYFQCGNPPAAGCIFPRKKVSEYMGTDATAISQTPSQLGKMVTGFAVSGAAAVCDVAAASHSGGGTLNVATLFHEAMHGRSGLMDRSLIQPDLMSLFGLNDFDSSDELTFLLLNNVLGGGAQVCAH